MSATADLNDFGVFLAQQRELRGLSREDVAKVTKIPEALIAALETGHSDRLPERVWVQNFVRSYAQAIGLEPEEALLRFEELRSEPSISDLSPVALERVRRKKALVQLALFLMVLALAAGLAIFIFAR